MGTILTLEITLPVKENILNNVFSQLLNRAHVILFILSDTNLLKTDLIMQFTVWNLLYGIYCMEFNCFLFMIPCNCELVFFSVPNY